MKRDLALLWGLLTGAGWCVCGILWIRVIGAFSDGSADAVSVMWPGVVLAVLGTILSLCSIIGAIVRFGCKPRIKPGHCECCYNLTGLPEPRCPECGQPFEARGETP